MRPIRAAFEKQQAFVADASHELRTPLTILRAQTEYLQRTQDLSSADLESGHQTMVREIDSMNRLVTDLLLLARSDNAALLLDRTRQNLTTIAEDAVDSFRSAAEEAGLSVTVMAPGETMATVDRDRILQVFRIVIDNAIKHTPSGGSVTVEIKPNRDAVAIQITDTGSGIEAADLAHIFDRFYRADQSRNRNQGGTGLGLTIARTLVEAHGGQIEVRSEPSVGTSVLITLPTGR